ncbi:MAG: flagellar basal body P-ring protein FlgI [Spirochaetes bacterium]|nr:MAG: flagellar basal body P-ring protein FlgI [Spirochaetota bacterium]
MRRITALAALMIALLAVPVLAEVKVKVGDLAYIDGLKENQLHGFGLVVGLQGTGDSKSVLTESSLRNFLKNLGMQEDEAFSTKNTAAVLVTAKLPGFARVGDKIAVSVSSMGDAKSLEGGTLLQSQLRGADDRTYAVAQGPLTFDDAGKGKRAVKTAARIPSGAIIEREIEPEVVVDGAISLILKNWDYSEANQVIKEIEDRFPDSKPEITKGGKIRVVAPADMGLAEFIAGVEAIEITPGAKAYVVVNEHDGTIVMGGEVKLSEALVSREGVIIKIEGKKAKKGSVAHIKESSSVKDLVDSLNMIGASTRDIIAILKALKDAGALHAELVIK